MLRRVTLAYALLAQPGCEALAPCVGEEEFFLSRGRQACEYSARCDPDALSGSIDDCARLWAEERQHDERLWVGDPCSTGIDECEAGRCLVVFARSTSRLCGTEMPDEHYDDPCYHYSYWEGATENCWDSVE